MRGGDAELAALRHAVDPIAGGREAREGAAAVLATAVPTDAGVMLLFERRPSGPKRFAGHLSFPGGRIEPDDPSALAAALREAEEEIGFSARHVDVLGHLCDTDDPLGRPVTCFLGTVDASRIPGEAASPDEVDEIILVPLADLRATTTTGAGPWPGHAYRVTSYESRMLPSRERIVQYWHLQRPGDGRRATLWGFTGGLVALLLDRMMTWSPPGPPRIVARWEDLIP